MASPCSPLNDVPLALRTTLEVGGRARYFLQTANPEEVASGLSWAREHDVDVAIIGGGSNLLIADRGFDGLVIRQRDASLEHDVDGDSVRLRVTAGMNWDALVAWSVSRGFAGLECLSGIPGDVGACPIQNIGAYGQEVADVMSGVVALERQSGKTVTFDREACAFGYRDSMFKSVAPDRYVVTSVAMTLRAGGAATLRYSELERRVRQEGTPTLAKVRETVLALRSDKSMVLDPKDENRRSAGSFFLNPIVSPDGAQQAMERAAVLAPGETMPRYPASSGSVKLSAAWLIERSGLSKGTVRGPVGLSTRHSLAIVNRGGATAAQIVDFAVEIQTRVRDEFGVSLRPEPRPLGFRQDEIAPLYGGHS